MYGNDKANGKPTKQKKEEIKENEGIKGKGKEKEHPDSLVSMV